MLDFLGTDANLPFIIALALMGGIALLEGVGALVGLSFSKIADAALPDTSVDVDVDADLDIDADLDVDADLGLDGDSDLDVDGAANVGDAGSGIVASAFAWLGVGRVPMMVLLIVLLSVFGVTGLVLQGVLHGVFDFYLPAVIAWVPALFVTVPVVRVVGRTFAKHLPKIETTALSKKSFIGLSATIIRGEAREGQPAEAKLIDEFGQRHYLLVEPEKNDEQFVAGDEVLLVHHAGDRFRGIRNPLSALVPSQRADPRP